MSSLNSAFFFQSRLPNLTKLLDLKKYPSEEMIIAAATDILNSFVYTTLVLNKESFSLSPKDLRENVKCLGLVGFPTIKTKKPLFERLSETSFNKFGVKLDRNKHIIVNVPTGIIGGATYVIFELPTPNL